MKKEKLFKGDNTFFEAKVVSRNMITDFVQGIRNMLGLELKAYTNTINEVANELINKTRLSEKCVFPEIDFPRDTKRGF